MKKGDIKVIAVVVLLVIISYSYLFYIGLNVGQQYVRMTQNQVLIHEIKLDASYSTVLNIEDDDHYNVVHIEEGNVWIEEANCLNQVCVNHKPISKVGETIVCIPHKLVIEIIGKDKTVDVIVE